MKRYDINQLNNTAMHQQMITSPQIYFQQNQPTSIQPNQTNMIQENIARLGHAFQLYTGQGCPWLKFKILRRITFL